MNIDIASLSIFILVSLFVLLFAGLPMAFVTGTIACIVSLVLWGPASMEVVLIIVTGFMKNYIFIAIPMFILMANFLDKSGVVEDLFRAVRVWFGPVGGGLAVTTIMAGTVMAAMTGIIGGSVVTLTLIALPLMLGYRYHKSLALGSIMAGGDLGTLIPPSVIMIIYGLVTSTSVGKLFIAGVVPGLLLSASYNTYVLIRCWLNPSLGPPLPLEERQISLRQKLALGKGLILPGLLIIIVLGSIYGGLATPTEAGAMGSLGALLCAAIHGKFNWKMLKISVDLTIQATCMVAWLAAGSLMLAAVYGLAGGIQFIERLMLALPLSPMGLIFLMMLILIFMGMFLNDMGMLFLTMPLFAPAVSAMGFDLVWFGVLFVMNLQIAYLTPPFAPSIFYVKGVAPPGISMMDIIKAVLPFLGIAFVNLLIVMLNPQIALWLPGQMIGN